MKNIIKSALIILDGFGINSVSLDENAIFQAKTPIFDNLFQKMYTQLDASGRAVGIPDGQMGNSEVGHLTIGAGKILRQTGVKISDLFQNKEFKNIEAFKKGIEHIQKNNSILHIFTLFGDGGVHSSFEHLKEMIQIIPSNISISLHLFGDGRDLEPNSMLSIFETFEKEILQKYANVNISSISGRYYAMDRDTNWERIQKVYNQIFFGKNISSFSPKEYIQYQYTQNRTDEFLEPVFFQDGHTVNENDVIFFLNFRSDRAKQLTQSIVSKDFSHFERKECKNLFFISMTKYYKEYEGLYFVEDEKIKNVLGKVLQDNQLTQLHIAETEKFAHVTKFFNGGSQEVFQGETDILIPSQKVATYDLAPEMQAEEIWKEFEKNAKNYNFTVVNFANGDMVGHTGVMLATVKAVEKLDEIVGKIIDYCAQNEIKLFITADHGNCEEMGTITHPKTSHTTNFVPFWYIVNKKIIPTKPTGGLAHIAPTILEVFGVQKPDEMNDSLL